MATNDLTLAQAVETANAMEAAARSAKQIHNKNTHIGGGGEGGSVHKVSQNYSHYRGKGNQNQGGPSNFIKIECFRCGGTRHSADACPFKFKECFKCRQVGHAKSKCRKTNNQNNNSQGNARRQGKIHWEGAEDISHDLVRENEDIELVEEGLNFVTLYKLEAVEVCDDKKEKEDQVIEESENEETASQLENEVRRYRSWVESTLEEYWNHIEDEVEEEDLEDYEFDEYLEQCEVEKEEMLEENQECEEVFSNQDENVKEEKPEEKIVQHEEQEQENEREDHENEEEQKRCEENESVNESVKISRK